MSVTSVQRTDRTTERQAPSAAASSGLRVSCSRRADVGRACDVARRAAHRRDALHGERGLTTENSR
ncbi:hypothetical protein BE20_20445 [Sorangium cellulosum]|uniref:Uncharacterized protein n=1 Tax=Sorangium cellulosum TaxID=56 RepID=A0A150SAB7_SORCE|nr:hypothetical protein BE20_20445 [Sorangium cellulosum]KYF94350.1 hypothetical protein BE18_50530 [Sorangium cellulosum]